MEKEKKKKIWTGQSWQPLPDHRGLEFRQYDGQRSYRFRHNSIVDMFGVMPEETAIRIMYQLRENRSKKEGYQTYKEMQEARVETAQVQAIVEKQERRRIINEEKFKDEHTVEAFWINTYWPTRKNMGSKHNNKTLVTHFEKYIQPILGKIPLKELRAANIQKMVNHMIENKKSEGTSTKCS